MNSRGNEQQPNYFSHSNSANSVWSHVNETAFHRHGHSPIEFHPLIEPGKTVKATNIIREHVKLLSRAYAEASGVYPQYAIEDLLGDVGRLRAQGELRYHGYGQIFQILGAAGIADSTIVEPGIRSGTQYAELPDALLHGMTIYGFDVPGVAQAGQQELVLFHESGLLPDDCMIATAPVLEESFDSLKQYLAQITTDATKPQPDLAISNLFIQYVNPQEYVDAVLPYVDTIASSDVLHSKIQISKKEIADLKEGGKVRMFSPRDKEASNDMLYYRLGRKVHSREMRLGPIPANREDAHSEKDSVTYDLDVYECTLMPSEQLLKKSSDVVMLDTTENKKGRLTVYKKRKKNLDGTDKRDKKGNIIYESFSVRPWAFEPTDSVLQLIQMTDSQLAQESMETTPAEFAYTLQAKITERDRAREIIRFLDALVETQQDLWDEFSSQEEGLDGQHVEKKWGGNRILEQHTAAKRYVQQAAQSLRREEKKQFERTHKPFSLIVAGIQETPATTNEAREKGRMTADTLARIMFFQGIPLKILLERYEKKYHLSLLSPEHNPDEQRGSIHTPTHLPLSLFGPEKIFPYYYPYYKGDGSPNDHLGLIHLGGPPREDSIDVGMYMRFDATPNVRIITTINPEKAEKIKTKLPIVI